MQRTIGLIQ
jgi:predicted transposase YdaD